MSKITRFTQKIFGSTAGIGQIGILGSLAQGSPAYTVDPATAQSLSNFNDGWYSAVVGENSPAIQDVNSLDFVITSQLAYMLQAGIPEWDSGTTYYIGSIAQDGLGNLYVSLQDNNTGNALSSSSFWGNSSGATRTVTANTTVLISDGYIRSNSTSGNLVMTLPAVASTALGKTIRIKDVGTGSHSTSVVGHSSELIDGNNTYSSALNQYDSVTLFNTGTGWDVI